MNDSPILFPDPEPGIDAAVRAHLDAEAARVNAGDLWSGVSARLGAGARAPLARRPRWRMAVAAGLAAAAVVGALAFLGPPAAQATPAQVLASAREGLPQRGDLHYRLRVEIPARAGDVLGALGRNLGPRDVWVRGRRFVVEPGLTRQGAWGRDGEGRVWAAPTRAAAARYDDAELPRRFRNLVTFFGLELRPLLDEVLAHFALAWSDAPGEGVYRVRATRQGPAGPFRVSAVEVAIDRRTGRILTLTAARTLPQGQTARVHVELVGVTRRPDAAYTAEGHVDPGAPVFDRRAPVQRRRLLWARLGAVLGNDL
jgi:hypothetical protein